jgi:RNA polymerase sigma-70 factor (ECF subfamily)
LSADAPLPGETIVLIERAGGGDRRAAEQLIVRYQQRVARFVIAQISDAAHYEDLCQTIFVKMVLALPRLREAGRFEPWLFQIARNVCRDHLRARSGWRRLFVSFQPAHEAVCVPEPKPDAEDAIERGMAALPDAQQSILKLSLDGTKSYEDMARLSGSSVSAVKSRLHRARENLRALLLAGDAE